MRVKHLVVGLFAATAMAVVPIAGAQENPDANASDASASFVSPLNKISKGKKAALEVRYRCDEGEALWVSAKQTETGERDGALKKEGSSEVANGWLQSHRNEFTCDGKSHTEKFKIDKVEDGSKGKLVKGEAWVQFCITGGRDLFLSKTGWVEVE